MKKVFLLLLSIVLNISIFGQTFYERGNIAEDTVKLENVEITGSYSAVKETPFTFQNIDSEEIQFRTPIGEPAVLLSYTPSVSYYSDNGLGNGYIYYRLRGIDQTRINSTLNGVPLNEPEDQGIYYNNYGGFLNSVSSVQIIRGAGLSKPGVSSYGGSINFNSLDFADKFKPNASIAMGSYNTFQGQVGVNSPNFFINGTYMNTDGYKYNSFNNSWSTFYGVKKEFKNNLFKLYGFVGKQRNGMAWLGESLDSIYSDPRYNSNTPDETDEFTQVHNQLIWERGDFTTTVYHTYLKGWYDMDMAHFDPTHPYGDLMYRLNLRSNWLGTILNYNLDIKDLRTNYGVSAYTYYRDHHGTYNKYSDEEPWYYEYQNTGYRKELAPYAKGNLKARIFSIYGDIQYRYTTFSYDGFEDFPTQTYNFLNWSGGTSLRLGNYSNVYYGIGRTNREPTRTDLFAGWDDYDPASYIPIEPETSLSNELGYKYLGKSLSLKTNLYYMNFQNEIVLNGQVGPNGIVLHQNAAKSFRSGLEIDANYKFTNGFELIWVSSFSYNQINQDGEKLQPVLSSPVILSADVLYNFNRAMYVGLNAKYNSKSYIDFSNEHTLRGYNLYNAYVGIGKNNTQLRANLNNIGNELILGNAIMGGDSPYYFAMAGINGSISLNLNF